MFFKHIVWTVLFALCAAMVQSTILQKLSLYNAVPDIVLLIIIWTSYHNGNMTGQVAGFFSGLLLDLLSSAPLGLNAFICTTIGASAGLLRGTFILDVLFFPMLMGTGATLCKALLFFILHFMFTDIVPSYTLDRPTLFVELGLNAFLAPVIFSFLNRFKVLLKETKQNATPQP